MATKKTTTNTEKKTTKKAKSKIKYWNSGITGACTVFGNKFEYGRGNNKKSFIKYLTTISRLEDGEDTDYITQFFLNNFSYDMTEDRDYRYDSEGFIEIAIGTSRKGSFESVYNNKVKSLTQWLKS